MKVYVLHADGYDYGAVMGIFTTEEKANEVMKILDIPGNWLHGDLSVEEHEVVD